VPAGRWRNSISSGTRSGSGRWPSLRELAATIKRGGAALRPGWWSGWRKSGEIADQARKAAEPVTTSRCPASKPPILPSDASAAAQ
jgi:hypothetical protein